MSMSKMTNIHDYLEAIGAEPPPIDEKELAEAKRAMIMCNSIEEAVELIEEIDRWEEVSSPCLGSATSQSAS